METFNCGVSGFTKRSEFLDRYLLLGKTKALGLKLHRLGVSESSVNSHVVLVKTLLILMQCFKRAKKSPFSPKKCQMHPNSDVQL